MDRVKPRQCVYMGTLGLVHQDYDPRLGGIALETGQQGIQVAQVGPGVVVAEALEELRHHEVRGQPLECLDRLALGAQAFLPDAEPAVQV